MKIEIDDDCLDGIMQGALVENYISLTNTLKKEKHLHPDDKDAYEKVIWALEVLGNWYFTIGEFKKAVKKAVKSKYKKNTVLWWLEQLPEGIREKAIKNVYEQKANSCSIALLKAFTWSKTKEGYEYWDKVSYVIVEKQMAFKGKINTMALKLGQHCYSYFTMLYRDSKKIIEYPAYHKTQVLGAKKNDVKVKYYRKKWAIERAIEILNFRNDLETLELLKCKKIKKCLSCRRRTVANE